MQDCVLQIHLSHMQGTMSSPKKSPTPIDYTGYGQNNVLQILASVGNYLIGSVKTHCAY